MTKALRKWVKYALYRRRSVMPYYGCNVYFPPKSIALRATCEQGIFEYENVRWLINLCKPKTYMFDVGCNLGLMSVPVLASVPESHVLAFEPSPNALPWLRRTISDSPFLLRWHLEEKAVSSSEGLAEFSLSAPEEGLFDGLRSTGRVAEAGRTKVGVTTIDLEWKRLGKPIVSVIKIDVEGGEIEVLRGATECIQMNRPFILLEWNRANLEAYGFKDWHLMQFAREWRFRLYALPDAIQVADSLDLGLQASRTENFLLAPIDES